MSNSPHPSTVKLTEDLLAARLGELSSPMENAVEVIKIMSKSPPPIPKLVVGPESDFGKVRCGCGAIIPFEQVTPIHTGVITAIEGLCPSCAPNFKGMARIVCCACKTVVGRMKPHDANGFKFIAEKCYHIDRCVFCDSTVESATIIELACWNKAHAKSVDSVSK